MTDPRPLVYVSPIDYPTTAKTPTLAAFAEGDAPAAPTALEGLAVPFGVVSGPSSDGTRYRFTGLPTNAEALVDVVEGHDPDAVIGRLARPWDSGDAGLDARARLFKTSRAADVLELTGEGVLTGFSVGAFVLDYTDEVDEIGPFRDVTAWEAYHLGVVRSPAFTETRGLRLAASAQKGHSMPPTPDAPKAGEVVELPTIAELAAQVAEVIKTGSDAPTHPLARFASREHFLAEFQEAARKGDQETTSRLAAEFAAADQITTNNPGLMPPGWRTEVKSNLNRRRPAIDATGGPIGLPESGMDSNWPYFDGDLDAMIAEQATQKTELASVRVDIKKATASIKTAGVYSDLSYQLLMRSTPSYLAQYLSINEAAWARYGEKQFETAIQTASVELGTGATLPAAGAGFTADVFRGLMFDASAKVDDVTGAPATVVLVAKDIWSELGKLGGLYNGKYGTQNVAGTASAATLEVDVNGLQVRRAPFLANGTVIVTNDLAAKFAESGPLVATDEDVAKLGRNVATWGMYVPAEVYFAAGLVRFDRTV